MDAFCLWKEVINLLTPYSGFREVHHALVFAAEIMQMDVKWMGMIHIDRKSTRLNSSHP